MTKKPSEKNKAWEKDRRDRLNKTFDELAKLLPKYDASIVWSKIEIIQKAIAFITEFQSKHEDYLKTQDPKLFREYEDFVNCLKFYQERNAQLTELLKKAKVPLPPVVLPQLLVNKPELLPNVSNVEAACLQKPKRQRCSARKNDAVLKKLEEDEESKCLSVGTQQADNIKNVDLKLVQPSPELKQDEKEAVSELHNTAFKGDPSQEYILPHVSYSPAKPIFLRIKKRKAKRKSELIRRPVVRKCYPHPEKLLRWGGKSETHPKVIAKQKRSSKRKCPRKGYQEKENTHVETSLPLREQSESPTAAFLLSFPVVTSATASGKNVENVESSVSLENLNNFFSSEEYNQFCDQDSASEVKLNVSAIASLPLESEEKIPISSKPMTLFSVSAITRPSSPKKRPASFDEQAATKRNYENEWMSENKFVHRIPVTSFDNIYSQKTTKSDSSNNQQLPSQHSTATTVTTNSFLTHQPKLSVGVSSSSVNVHSNQKACPTQIPSSSSVNPPTVLTSDLEKTLTEVVTSKTRNVDLGHVSKQMPSVHHELPITNTTGWNAKSAASNKVIHHNAGVSMSKNISHVSVTEDSKNLLPSDAAAKVSMKTSFYSPAKSFFYEFSTQNQPINSFNFGRSPVVTVSSSQSDPLFSSTITTKSQPFLSFPSIKPEFPWLQPSTTAFTMSLTPITATTTAASNSNVIPFDLGAIVSEPLASTNFTLSLSTSKSFDASLVDSGNKQITENKCIIQANIFPSCDELQFTPRVSSSVNKQSSTQVNVIHKELPWKQKTKDISEQIFYDCEQSKMQQKTHVNWMTSNVSDFSPTGATGALPPIDFVNQCPTSAAVDFGFGCRKDAYDDDNQFINWSPTKPLNTDFSAAYTFENFGSNEAPPNKTVKQIFSVSQLVDQTPSQESSTMKKTVTKGALIQKSAPVKQTFSNIYSAESLIAKKDNHRMSNAGSFYNQDTSNTHTDYHNMSNYIYSYPSTQGCLQSENDYLGASAYATSSTVKTTSIHSSTGAGVTATGPTMPGYESSIVSSSNNYFGHSNAVNTNDPYDPTYFPSNNYNHPSSANWNPCTTKSALSHSYNQSQVPLTAGYGNVETVCQQNSNASGNLTNFNLSSICPEIDGKHASTGW